MTITVLKLKHALLPIPTNEATCIEEAIGGFIAWPKRLVIVQTNLSQASQGPSHTPDREVEGSKQTKKKSREEENIVTTGGTTTTGVTRTTFVRL